MSLLAGIALSSFYQCRSDCVSDSGCKTSLFYKIRVAPELSPSTLNLGHGGTRVHVVPGDPVSPCHRHRTVPGWSQGGPRLILLSLTLLPLAWQECLSRLLSPCGPIQSVELQEKPDLSESKKEPKSRFFHPKPIPVRPPVRVPQPWVLGGPGWCPSMCGDLAGIRASRVVLAGLGSLSPGPCWTFAVPNIEAQALSLPPPRPAWPCTPACFPLIPSPQSPVALVLLCPLVP